MFDRGEAVVTLWNHTTFGRVHIANKTFCAKHYWSNQVETLGCDSDGIHMASSISIWHNDNPQALCMTISQCKLVLSIQWVSSQEDHFQDNTGFIMTLFKASAVYNKNEQIYRQLYMTTYSVITWVD